MLKKSLIACFIFLSIVCITKADDLANLLQDLAIQTACLGMYSSTEASKRDGVINYYPDPPDWYTPPIMASRFAYMSGERTRTNTFYGICFDYAQFAWDDIKKYQPAYNKAGMKGQQWYIAVAFPGDPNTVILYDPVSPEKATSVLNGVPVREYAHHKVRTHDNVTGHAWLWVQHENGIWYWIDPTWTDNTGYPWWGIVEKDKEVLYYPNPEYCIASDYPRPLPPNKTPEGKTTRSPDSSYDDDYTASPRSYTGLSFGYISAFDFNNKFGFTLAIDDCFPTSEYALVGSLYLDYLKSNTEIGALLIGFTAGYQFFYNYVVYVGGGIGFSFPTDKE